jgi:ribonuclease VapC
MFLDASAIVAIIAGEADAATLAARLGQAQRPITSPVAVWEATISLARVGHMAIADATAVLGRFLAEVGATVVEIDTTCGQEAISAFDRFGEGRHPAALNLGDCFTYACARVARVPVLCKGNDFPRTDIEIA